MNLLKFYWVTNCFINFFSYPLSISIPHHSILKGFYFNVCRYRKRFCTLHSWRQICPITKVRLFACGGTIVPLWRYKLETAVRHIYNKVLSIKFWNLFPWHQERDRLTLNPCGFNVITNVVKAVHSHKKALLQQSQ